VDKNRFRFLHAADVHLDSPLTGLDRYESAPVETMRGATRRAFENLVDLAMSEAVAFVLLAGDLYDGPWKDYQTGLFFVAQMAKLREAGILVFIVAGNHDAESQITKSLRLPDNVHLFSTNKPETRLVEPFGVAIHGQGFATRAVTDDLAAAYPVADASHFHIGLLHTSLDGRPDHAPYAPTSTQILAQKGYHYWALGHVHKREVVSKDPWIVFPGNLQGRRASEVGPKGCVLVTVEDSAVINVEQRHVDVMRWAVCRVAVDGATTTSDLLDRVARSLTAEADGADGRALAVRVEVTGPVSCHDEIAANPNRWTQEVRALATGVSSAGIWIEKVRFSTARPIDLAALAARDDALGSFLNDLVSGGPDETTALQNALADIRRALPPELFYGDDAIDPHAPETLSLLIAEAREMLLARIAREGGPP